MLDTHVRLDALYNKTADGLLRLHLRPNHVTGVALVIGLGAGGLLYAGYRVAAVVLLWLSGFLDAVDGSMARKTGTASLAGAMFDIVSDRIVELSIFWALALRRPDSLYAMLGLVSAVLLSMTVFLTTGMLARKEGGKSFYYQAGLMERTEGFIASTAMMLFPRWLVPLTWVYTALIGVTIVQRLLEARRLLKDRPNDDAHSKT